MVPSRPSTCTDGSQYRALILNVPDTRTWGRVEALKARYLYKTPGSVDSGYGGSSVLFAAALIGRIRFLQTGVGTGGLHGLFVDAESPTDPRARARAV